MLGSALGDAIGELAFSSPEVASLRSQITHADRLVYADDAATAIGLAESILQIGDLEPKHLGDTFSANYLCEPWRRDAIGPPKIFARVAERGTSCAEADQSLLAVSDRFKTGRPIGLRRWIPSSTMPRIFTTRLAYRPP
jgi:poly(ADP-ribose) glycohydrolase ARH3